MQSLGQQINEALGAELPSRVTVEKRGVADLPSCFPVTDLAVSSIGAAAAELAALTGAAQVTLDRRLASLWFDMTLHPTGWEMPSPWDAIAGVYEASGGWIRLHTNAPHHRDAALHVLGCDADRDAVARAVASWDLTELEQAVVSAGGAAAAMRGLSDWAKHAQGRAVAAEPLIAWEQTGDGMSPATLEEVKILDLTRVLAGPVATRFLAGFGARVLRIDPPWWDEPGVIPEVALGKACAGLDLTQEPDRLVFERLLREADVLVHGYRPGALEGLGFGAEERRSLAPHLIDVSLCAYGWTGPWGERRGFDSLVQMSCGIAQEGMVRTGAAKPVPLPVQALDHATGYLMAAAVLRALRLRAETGQVMSARLSLARTAALLVSQGSHGLRGGALDPIPEDFDAKVEMTGWGSARRIAFPVMLDGKGPCWRHPAGQLRRNPARW